MARFGRFSAETVQNLGWAYRPLVAPPTNDVLANRRAILELELTQMRWIWDNRTWIFSGAGVSAFVGIIYIVQRFITRRNPELQTVGHSSHAETGAAAATGSHISQTVNSPTILNSPTINMALPPPSTNIGNAGYQRYAEWRELLSELHESFKQIGYAFYEINVISAGDESNDANAGIRRGYRVIRNRLLIADILKRNNVLERYEAIVRYALSAHGPRDPNQQGCPTVFGFNEMASHLEDELTKLAQANLADAVSQSPNEVLKTQLQNFVNRFEAEWKSEQNIGWANMDAARQILRENTSRLLDFLAAAKDVSPQNESLQHVIRVIESKTRELASKHPEKAVDRTYETNAFWNSGFEIIKLLKEIKL